MLANLIAAHLKDAKIVKILPSTNLIDAKVVKILPYELDLTGLDWNVKTDGAKLDIVGHGWDYHNDGT